MANVVAPPPSRKVTLSNCVRVLLEELPHVHSASIGFWVDTGSRNESPEIEGASHFIEHMLFKGTATRSALEIARALEDTGGSLNAFTNKEQTCYYARVLEDQVELALEVLSDMLLNSLFDPDEVKRERKVILEEIKMYEDNPDEYASELFQSVFWPDHPMGRPIAGTRQSVRRLSREALLDYKQHFYAADRLVVSIAGRIDGDRVVEQLERLLAPLPRKSAPHALTAPTASTRRVVKYRDTEQVQVLIGTAGVAVDHPDLYIHHMLDAILGGGMSARLFQQVREKRGLCYSISSYGAHHRLGGMFGIYAGTNARKVDDLLAVTFEELRRPVTPEELDRAKRQSRGNLLLALEQPRTRANRMARNELFHGRFIPIEEILDRMEAVTVEQVSDLASRMTPDRFSFTIVGPVRRIKAL
ncbi:MAG: pitrilysin family protein [Candidatus Sericytochromatia bacterium]|nr:pitrilysin family protein [Candidatus Sericytochromatia bacterium]